MVAEILSLHLQNSRAQTKPSLARNQNRRNSQGLLLHLKEKLERGLQAQKLRFQNEIDIRYLKKPKG